MEIRTLRYFVEVARCKSFTLAAHRLSVTQPTLSRQIADMEVQLGQVLFERNTRKVTLTEKGLYLFRQAESILALIDRTEKEVMSREELTGEIVISAAETPDFDLVAQTIHEFTDRFPSVRCCLISSNATDTADRLRTGLADFGVMILPADLDGFHFLELPGHNSWGLLTRRDGVFKNHEAITPRDLQGVPLFVANRKPFENLFTGWLGYPIAELKIAGTYTLLYNASRVVRQGSHALCQQGIVAEDEEIKFLPLKPAFTVKSVFAWPQVRPKRLVADVFLDLLREKIRQRVIQSAIDLNETSS